MELMSLSSVIGHRCYRPPYAARNQPKSGGVDSVVVVLVAQELLEIGGEVVGAGQ
ncbi:MAG: hypothetical protein AAB131_10715 [Actinomycetota bacterium]